VRLDLDAEGHTLHVHVDEAHLLVQYGQALDEVLAVLDDAKDTLAVATLGVYLPKLVHACRAVFIEREGRLARVERRRPSLFGPEGRRLVGPAPSEWIAMAGRRR
jgi:hypothetical protein